jgi:hypothetical protein
VLEGGLSHEHVESITDPEPNNAWTDFATGEANGYEIGDKCGASLGTSLGEASNGASYNQVINGHFYWYQEEWSNQTTQCLQRLTFSGAEPTATFTSAAGAGNEMTFNATGSTAPGGVSRYDWQFNDGPGLSTPVETTTPTVSHLFSTKGQYLVALTVFASNGTSIGTARTIRVLPTVLTGAASALTQTSATLNATVNPNSGSVSDCHFEYGPTETYGSSTTCVPSPGSGSSAVSVSASIGGLAANATYHFRVSATNPGGTSKGLDQAFTTLSTSHWYVNGSRTPLGELVPTISWGALTLESSAGGSVTCKTASAANIENTAGTAKQETVTAVRYECKAVGGACAAAGGETRVTGEGLPWLGSVTEQGAEGSEEFRQESSRVEDVECYKGGALVERLVFQTGLVGTETGASTPKWQNNGPTTTKPSESIFEIASGHLYSEIGGQKLTTKGHLKVSGYEGTPVPLITVAKP